MRIYNHRPPQVQNRNPYKDRPKRHADQEARNQHLYEGSKEEKVDSVDEAGAEAVVEIAEASDETARIYWKWFELDKFVFQGKISTRDEFLPKCGKMKG